MTAKQVFEYALVELNKKNAPSLLLEDYNYFINKAINQYVNLMYNAYDLNQQKTDDLRVLKSSAILVPQLSSTWATSNLWDKTYSVDLPDDYLHTLNCVVEYNVLQTYKCYNIGSKWQQGAKRLTADMLSQIIQNYYLRPSYKNPYYYINNINLINIQPTLTNQVEVSASKYVLTVTSANVTTTSQILITTFDGIVTTITATLAETAAGLGATIMGTLPALQSNIIISNNTIYISDTSISDISILGPGLDISKFPSSERIAQNRYGNQTKVRMEIRYGKDNSTFQLSTVYLDYLKVPQFIRLTQDQVDEVSDVSQILEFPDYVCQEIVNGLIKLLLENSSDPRLQTNIPINQSIANPAQEQQPQTRKK